MVTFRLSVEDKELMGKVCAARGEDTSSFVRRCVRLELDKLGYYSQDVMQARARAIDQMGVQYD